MWTLAQAWFAGNDYTGLIVSDLEALEWVLESSQPIRMTVLPLCS